MTTNPTTARDRLFALIASIPGSGTVDWCDQARDLLDEIAAVPVPPTTHATDALRDRIQLAIHSELTEYRLGRDTGLIVQRLTDAALRVLPPDADRGSDLLKAADALDADMERFFAEWPDEPRNSPYALGQRDAAAELRRLAAEAQQQPDTETLPPPEGPEYMPCACGHIEPEHGADSGVCLTCGCEGYRPCTCGVAGDAFVPLGHYADCPQAAAPAVVSQPGKET